MAFPELVSTVLANNLGIRMIPEIWIGSIESDRRGWHLFKKKKTSKESDDNAKGEEDKDEVADSGQKGWRGWEARKRRAADGDESWQHPPWQQPRNSWPFSKVDSTELFVLSVSHKSALWWCQYHPSMRRGGVRPASNCWGTRLHPLCCS